MTADQTVLNRARWVIGFVIFGLVMSGVTAFPLRWELGILAQLVTGADGQSPRFGAFPGLTEWVLRVRDGLEETGERFPFLAYGTDWLAFGHLTIALFFVLPFRDPIRFRPVLWVGVVASILVIPTAMICGEIRGIPWFWRMIDCGFGVGCIIPLWWALRLIPVEADSR